MRDIINNILEKLEYYSEDYENGAIRVFSILTFFIFMGFVNLYFAFYFALSHTYELAIFNIITVITAFSSVYITINKHKYLLAQYLMVFIVCTYSVYSAYFLGYDKCAHLLFYPLLYAYFTVSPTKRIHHTISAILTVISFFLTLYVRFTVPPKYGSIHGEIEFVNLFLSISCTYFTIITISVSEKIAGAVRHDTINTLENEANTDFLTGLYNKRYIEDELSNNANFINCFVVLGDIDFFKKVNDTYGHITGDYTLKTVAEIMKSIFRNNDFIVRWGGEEFLIIIKETNTSYVLEKLQTLSQLIKDHDFEFADNKFKITMTFGVKKADHSFSFQENAKVADDALYYGKQNGRDCIVYANDNGEFTKHF